MDTIWASKVGVTNLRLQNLRKHQQSPTHISAVVKLTKCQACQQDLVDKLSPSPKHMKTILETRLEGALWRNDEFHGHGRHKTKRMQFLLAEARRNFLRNHLLDCDQMLSCMDGKVPRITMRFTATTMIW